MYRRIKCIYLRYINVNNNNQIKWWQTMYWEKTCEKKISWYHTHAWVFNWQYICWGYIFCLCHYYLLIGSWNCTRISLSLYQLGNFMVFLFSCNKYDNEYITNRSYMSNHGLLLQWARAININLSLLV